MGLINREIARLYGGVSRQPPFVRADYQLQEEVNCWSDPVVGLVRRAGSESLARVSSADKSASKFHTINRSVNERFIVEMDNGSLSVWGLDGTQHTITAPNGYGYLNCNNPRTDLVALSVADYTFIVNKTVTCAMAAAGEDQSPQPSYNFWLNLVGEYGNGGQQQYPPNPSESMSNFKGTVQTFQDLPGGPNDTSNLPSQGDIWAIQGDASNRFSTYYVRYNNGVWDETVKPGLQNLPDATTLPHALVHNPDGTFLFVPFSWAPRRVGDDTENLNPSFIGREIKDVFFWRNRLGLMTSSTMILSRAGDFGNFYRMTMTEVLDDDVIDEAVGDTGSTQGHQAVPSLEYCVPTPEGPMLFSDGMQFLTDVRDILKPGAVAIKEASSYKADLGTPPVPSGNSVFFPSKTGEHMQMREYTVYQNKIDRQASDVSSHCAGYIPSGTRTMSASDEFNSLFLASDLEPNHIYVYQYLWMGNNNLVQSAWKRWEMNTGDKVLSLSALDHYLYVVVVRNDGTYIERIDIQQIADTDGLPYQAMLDRRGSAPVSAVTGAFQVTLPYTPADQSKVRVILPGTFPLASGYSNGYLVSPTDYTWVAPNVVQIPDKYIASGGIPSGTTVIAGDTFKSYFTFSPLYMKSMYTKKTVTGGSLTIRDMRIDYYDTGYFEVAVDPYGIGSPDTVGVIPADLSSMTGQVVGGGGTALGQAAFDTGSYEFDVEGEGDEATITIQSTAHVQFKIQGGEWRGWYTNHARIF